MHSTNKTKSQTLRDNIHDRQIPLSKLFKCLFNALPFDSSKSSLKLELSPEESINSAVTPNGPAEIAETETLCRIYKKLNKFLEKKISPALSRSVTVPSISILSLILRQVTSLCTLKQIYIHYLQIGRTFHECACVCLNFE